MRNWVLIMLLTLAVPAFLAPTIGCDCLYGLCPFLSGPTQPDDGGDNGDNGDVDDGDDDVDDGDDDVDDGDGDSVCDHECLGGCSIVKTDIALRHDGSLRVGDDLIAFGTGALNGVSYIIPSENPTAGTPVPNSDSFRSKGFAVGGRTIFLIDGNFLVSVLNVDVGGNPITIPEAELRLVNIPVGPNDAGHIQADGDYCVTRCSSDNVIRVVDASGATPVVIPLNNPPGISSGFGVQQVAIEAATMRVIAAAGGSLYIYDLNNPTVDPVAVALPDDISNTIQMKVAGDYLIALDDQSYEEAFLVDLATPQLITLPDGNASAKGFAVGGDTFAFFADFDADDGVGGGQRAAVGELPGPSFTKAALGDQIDGSTNNNGLVGFGASMCITPDGNCLYLADSYLQYRTTGASFAVPADPEGADPYACPAWDIHCSNNTVGFKTAVTTSTDTKTVGYIRLVPPAE